VSVRTDPLERQATMDRLAGETDDQLRHDLAYWGVAVLDHEARCNELRIEFDAVQELHEEAQAHVRLVADELSRRRDRTRARGGPS